MYEARTLDTETVNVPQAISKIVIFVDQFFKRVKLVKS